ncbi:hypothetical protein N9164_12530 [Draconibacterium sp.]|nr:hypothetical protein [Draconibacterium sp.]
MTDEKTETANVLPAHQIKLTAPGDIALVQLGQAKLQQVGKQVAELRQAYQQAAETAKRLEAEFEGALAELAKAAGVDGDDLTFSTGDGGTVILAVEAAPKGETETSN